MKLVKLLLISILGIIITGCSQVDIGEVGIKTSFGKIVVKKL